MAKKKIIGRHDKVMDLTYGKKYNPKDKINAAASGDWLNGIGSAMGGVTGILKGYTDNSTVKKREDLENEAKLALGETFNGVSSIDALLAARNAYAPMPAVQKKSLIPTTKERLANDFNAITSGVSAGANLGNWWLAAGLGALGGVASELGYAKAGREADRWLGDYRTLVDAREDRLNRAARYQLGNIYENSYNGLMANYSDAGGQLGGNRYKSGVGSIAVPDIFTHGGIFSNGMELINAGGSHEENPNGGVTVSYDEQGIPNLVEEGEVIFNDYVFSNRFAPTKELLTKYNLPETWDKYTFARIAEDMGKESRERPNDPISKRGLESSMETLSAMQEEYKEMERQKEITKAIKRMTPEEKAAMFDAATAQEQQMYGNPEEMYAAQMPQEMPVEGMEETPAFMPQEYASGGNIFDGTRQSRLQRSLNRNLRAAEIRSNRQQTLDTNAISEEQSTANEAIARNIAKALLRQAGVENPSRTLLNRTIQTLTGAQAINEFSRSVDSTLPGSVAPVRVRTVHGEPTLEGLVALASSLGIDTSTTEGYNRVRSIFTNAFSGREAQPAASAASAAEAPVEDRVALAAALGNLGQFTPFSYNPPSGGGGGNRGGNPEAGSATKAAEEDTIPLQKIVDDTARRAQEDVFAQYGIVSNEAEKRVNDALSTGLTTYMSDLISARDAKDRKKLADKARGRGVGSRTEDDEDEPKKGLPTGLRYAGALASGLGAIASLFEEPDYTHAEQIRRAGRPYGEVTFKPVENYMTYRPVDRNFMINQMRNNSLGLARQLVGANGTNPGAATQGLLALNYGTNQNIGQGLIQADLTNAQQEERVRSFNRATDQYNSEGMFKESVYNRDRFQPLTQPEILAAQMEAQEDAYLANARSQGLSNFADALTGIGEDNMAYNMATSAPWLYYDYMDDILRRGVQQYKKTASCGGAMKSRKRRK